MQPQVEDPRLRNHYNMIVFDTRITGKSRCRYSGKHDLWVTAADLAHAFYHLRLPPAHIFAPDLYSMAALRFAALFPELCLSLTLCNVPPPTEVKTVFDSMEELNHMWGFAEDLESYEYACKEFLNFFGGTHAPPDLQDEIVAFWESYYPPFRRSYSMAVMNLFLNRTPMTAKELASIICPVVIIQAEKSLAHPFRYAEQLQRELTGVLDAAKVIKSHGTNAGYLSVVVASVVNKSLANFLAIQPRPDPVQNAETYNRPLWEFMLAGLQRLADMKGDPTIANRDPLSPLSFSCVSPDTQKSQEEMVAKYISGQQAAFSPLGPDGRPMRRFSERQNHWLEPGRDGFSRSELSKRVNDVGMKRRLKVLWSDSDRDAKRNLTSDSGGSLPTSIPLGEEIVTLEDQQIARVLRANVITPTVDKQVLKGAAAKLSQSPGQTLRSFIRS
ncbi:uncharacterized protein PHACADRAFT_250189 [Phanerochaete carnosa HHB-10118-sp]|uniref:AB hydrolase-1 domain-containing protein n=1 Tax=Phanerochaete carnosa (strain HHB-10118-sp) TaxID=650164 RepID=K5X9L1_PHACS|nr:uncharacterized protein PHACADRAFT_250189 [Phanerochaete carnosa HHB-10118-sp]EKM59592.1 hypothetical protein PHACADRAFT_250189 [Phanerochaete carnosa HHB-10118-sp]